MPVSLLKTKYLCTSAVVIVTLKTVNKIIKPIVYDTSSNIGKNAEIWP